MKKDSEGRGNVLAVIFCACGVVLRTRTDEIGNERDEKNGFMVLNHSVYYPACIIQVSYPRLLTVDTTGTPDIFGLR